MPQLDGLRAIAVMGVMVHHFYPQASTYIPLGMGVRLFFSLSGFLITGILLRSRDVSTLPGASRIRVLGQFYIRRVLRIFPIYYLTLALLCAAGVRSVRKGILWHLAYLSNLYFARHMQFDGVIGHFWTLAVEEQFYLLWPWFVLFLPRKWLPGIALLAMLVGPLYRDRIVMLDWKRDTAAGLTLANIDVLAAGALLALLAQSAAIRSKALRWYDAINVGIGVPALLILLALHALSRESQTRITDYYFVFLNTAMAMAFTGLIYHAARGIKNPLGAVLQCWPMRYIGKISYGLYIYHMVMPTPLRWIYHRTGLVFPEAGARHLCVCVTATFAVSLLSWHAIEKPINRLKRFFPYGSRIPFTVPRCHMRRSNSGDL